MFGERLKELRHNNKLTQQELANKLKVSASTIGMYEQGRRSPDTGTLNQVAEHFDVSVDWLLGRTDIPNNELIEKYLDIILSQIEYLSSFGEPIPMEVGGTSLDTLTDLSKAEKIAVVHSVLKDIKEKNGDLELDFYVHDTPTTDKNSMGNSDIKNPYKDNVPTKKTSPLDEVEVWFHKTDGYKELPEEAQKELSDYIMYLRHKYGDKE